MQENWKIKLKSRESLSTSTKTGSELIYRMHFVLAGVKAADPDRINFKTVLKAVAD